MTLSERSLTSPAFGDLRPAALEALSSRAREIEFRPGERIAALIRPPRRLLVILSGVAKLAVATIDGQERIVYVFRPGDVVGSRVLLDESPEGAYEIVAMTRVEALAIEIADFHAISRDHPDVLIAVTRAFSRRLEKLTDRLMAAMSEEVSVRLCRLLLDFVDDDHNGTEDFVHLSHPLTHETMAHIVGASRPHTSSVLAELEELGVVERRRRDLLVWPSRLAAVVRHEREFERHGDDGTHRLGQRVT